MDEIRKYEREALSERTYQVMLKHFYLNHG